MRHPTRRKTTAIGKGELVCYSQIEAVPSKVTDGAWNVHLHGMSIVPPEDTVITRPELWADLWKSSIGTVARSTDMQIADNIDAVLQYVAKDFFVVADTLTCKVLRPEFIKPTAIQILPADMLIESQDQRAGVRIRSLYT